MGAAQFEQPHGAIEVHLLAQIEVLFGSPAGDAGEVKNQVERLAEDLFERRGIGEAGFDVAQAGIAHAPGKVQIEEHQFAKWRDRIGQRREQPGHQMPADETVRACN